MKMCRTFKDNLLNNHVRNKLKILDNASLKA